MSVASQLLELSRRSTDMTGSNRSLLIRQMTCACVVRRAFGAHLRRGWSFVVAVEVRRRRLASALRADSRRLTKIDRRQQARSKAGADHRPGPIATLWE